MSLNKVLMIGNLTRDPELRHAGNTPVCELRLAVNREWKNKAGEKQKDTCYVDVTAWAAQADSCKRFLAKGSKVLVEGSLELEEWEAKDGSGRRSKRRST